jgi:hypothetical protein
VKEPKMLNGFEELIDKKVLKYVHGYFTGWGADVDIIITNEYEILVFYASMGWDDPTISCIDNSDILNMIHRDKSFRELLLSIQLIDTEYIDKLLEAENKQKQIEEENEKQRKINQYNKLKEELGL